MKQLNRDEMKNLKGGVLAWYSGSCGVKVNGVWHPAVDNNGNGHTQDEAISYLGQTVYGYDENYWSPDGFTIYPGGSYSGVVTRWCCDSCWWNKTYV